MNTKRVSGVFAIDWVTDGQRITDKYYTFKIDIDEIIVLWYDHMADKITFVPYSIGGIKPYAQYSGKPVPPRIMEWVNKNYDI